ncbi:LuxR C-terminal-related transcriptional regulator [Streptomyces sp. NPDC051907]|uniref:helix-turn-helix transcriptional regulator n=1 Tax=Streptomyces sp. NPDC051907 TaxID=3155284 RepID=UPI003426FCC6
MLIADSISEHHFVHAVHCGLVSVAPRREAVRERVVKAVAGARDGRPELPPVAVGWLTDHLRAVQRDVLEPHELTAAGLLRRETEVVRLLADGMSTAQTARRLELPERTVKNVIHEMLTRLRLRNRTHAVAHALRQGAR